MAKAKPSANPRAIASGVDVWCRHDDLLDVTGVQPTRIR